MGIVNSIYDVVRMDGRYHLYINKDNGDTISVLSNEEMYHSIQTSDKPLYVDCHNSQTLILGYKTQMHTFYVDRCHVFRGNKPKK